MRFPTETVGGLAFALLFAVVHAAASDADAPAIAPFSAVAPGDALPRGWKHSPIKGVARTTEYTVVDDGGMSVLRAEAASSASAVVYKVSPVAPGAARLQWRWKTSRSLKSGNPATKEGDDYAARVYVMFDYPLERLPFAERMKLRLARALYDPELPAAALCYVRDARQPAGTIMASPYTARVRLIVADTGIAGADRWATIERDVVEDFRAAFGEEPPAISAVAVATDTDNTKETLTAWYGDIVLKKREVTAPAR